VVHYKIVGTFFPVDVLREFADIVLSLSSSNAQNNGQSFLKPELFTQQFRGAYRGPLACTAVAWLLLSTVVDSSQEIGGA